MDSVETIFQLMKQIIYGAVYPMCISCIFDDDCGGGGSGGDEISDLFCAG